MRFQDLQGRLLTRVRTLVRNGVITERGLARMARISQPHIHNVLKGVRILTPDVADTILNCLELDVLDLIESREIEQQLRGTRPSYEGFRKISTLRHPIGPGRPWVDELDQERTFSMPVVQLAGILKPLGVHAIRDELMTALSGGTRMLLVDLSIARVEHNELYIIDVKGHAIVRRAVRCASGGRFESDFPDPSESAPRWGELDKPIIRAQVVKLWDNLGPPWSAG
ncbi:MAG: helix-turn-helix transcriptional regulator [Pyrinomonadaceae bacterium]|nr:helix-turn-helix transcriptional regulator [Pyrinomonadaceae bacterium]